MLVLSRKRNEVIYIGDSIQIKISQIKGNSVSLAISAPEELRIVRAELLSGNQPITIPRMIARSQPNTMQMD